MRFSSILKIEQREFIAGFQESLRAKYPSLQQDQSQMLALGPEGMVPQAMSTRWRFVDVSDEWVVSLTRDFIAIETTRYPSRHEFFARLAEVLEQVHLHFAPNIVERIGVRYIDRIGSEALGEIATLVRPELAGVLQTSFGATALHALSEHIFDVDGARVLVRAGLLHANKTIDPAVIRPIDEKSWLLDLDMFKAAKKPFVPAAIAAEARGYAERLYAVFRWAVTPAFLSRYGGEA